MIKKWLSFITTPCSKVARKLGYLHEAIAIGERHSRQQRSWQPHLDQSKKFIMDVAVQCSGKETVVILGSGPLLDVPLEQLATTFEQVYLVDIIHLPEVRKHVRNYSNIQLIESDLSCLGELILNKKINSLPSFPKAPELPIEGKVDLVVSLNLISQLPLNPVYALQDIFNLSEEDTEEWKRRIQQTHWDWLIEFAEQACVITDTEHQSYYASGDKMYFTQLLHIEDLPNPNETWSWHLVPAGVASRQSSTLAQVSAWHLGPAG
ncbi:hypothetical protein N9B94_01340 [Verrucomicrobia bacterium]|nr:hypothetical protein [Verrucomicrobiota bacterium]